jgi:hypothetical protein
VQRNGVRYRSRLKGGRLQVNSPARRILTLRPLLCLAVEPNLARLRHGGNPAIFSDQKKLSIATLSQTLPERFMLQTHHGLPSVVGTARRQLTRKAGPRRSRSRQNRRLARGSAQRAEVRIPRRPKHFPMKTMQYAGWAKGRSSHRSHAVRLRYCLRRHSALR